MIKELCTSSDKKITRNNGILEATLTDNRKIKIEYDIEYDNKVAFYSNEDIELTVDDYNLMTEYIYRVIHPRVKC